MKAKLIITALIIAATIASVVFTETHLYDASLFCSILAVVMTMALSVRLTYDERRD